MASEAFPYRVISGIAGEFTQLYSHYLEPPAEFFYFSFITCLGSLLADKVGIASELKTQPRFYTVLIGESGTPRKSTAAQMTIEFFKEAFEGEFHHCYAVGSAEGLQRVIQETDTAKLLILFDEFKSFISKCRIEGSVLLPCVNTLFESNHYESHTKTTSICLDRAFLSILACTTKDTFDGMWSSQFTDIGFNNRLFLVPGTGKRKNAIPLKIPIEGKGRIKERLTQMMDWIKSCGEKCEFGLSDEAWIRYEKWYKEELESSIHATRLETYAMRLMLLLTVNEGKTEIDYDIVEKTIAILTWQLEVRRELDPIDAENNIAKLEQSIKKQLTKHGECSKRHLQQYCNAKRYGIWFFDTALKNLLRDNEVTFDAKNNLYRISGSVVKNVVSSH